jgi:hypothetical protein
VLRRPIETALFIKTYPGFAAQKSRSRQSQQSNWVIIPASMKEK